MTSVRTKVSLALQLGVGLLIWILLLKAQNIPMEINLKALSFLPTVFSIYALILVSFEKWIWQFEIFQGWFVIVPNLQGTWKGELVSTWENSESALSIAPIEAYLVIRQDLRNIHIKCFTAESMSVSLSAAIQIDEIKNLKTLDYSYSNKPIAEVRERSEIHYGAANLIIAKIPELKLEGDYWTDRKTIGRMRFKFHTKEEYDSFPSSS